MNNKHLMLRKNERYLNGSLFFFSVIITFYSLSSKKNYITFNLFTSLVTCYSDIVLYLLYLISLICDIIKDALSADEKL